MVVIDRNNCMGCGKCASMIILLPILKESDNVEYYQDPVGGDIEFVENCALECWGHCIYIIKDKK